MLDCGSDQGRSEVETRPVVGGIAAHHRGFQPSRNTDWAERCRLWMDTDKGRRVMERSLIAYEIRA
jgi:hypothetical protein